MLRRPQVPANFRIHISRKSFLLSASHYVSANFRWYTAGQVPASKAERLVAKFDRAYGILDNKREFENKRRRGAARSRLLMLLPDHEGIKVTTDTPVDFILLSSDGTGAVHELENLIRIQSGSPLRYGNLVYRNNGGMKGGGKQKSHWSWFFNQQFYQDMREMFARSPNARPQKSKQSGRTAHDISTVSRNSSSTGSSFSFDEKDCYSCRSQPAIAGLHPRETILGKERPK